MIDQYLIEYPDPHKDLVWSGESFCRAVEAAEKSRPSGVRMSQVKIKRLPKVRETTEATPSTGSSGKSFNKVFATTFRRT